VFERTEWEKGASPQPSPKGEGEQLAGYPVVLERTEWGKSSLKHNPEQPLPRPLSEGRGE